MSSDLCHLIVILGLFFGILVFIALGPYTLSLRILVSQQELTLHFVLVSLLKCFKIEWYTDGSHSENRMVFFWISLSGVSFLKSKENTKRISVSHRIPWKVFLKSIIKWLVKIRPMIRIRTLKLDCTFGTGNPLITGLLYGIFYTVFQNKNGSVEIRVSPDFFRRTFSAKGKMIIQFVLFRILWAYRNAVKIQMRREYGH